MDRRYSYIPRRFMPLRPRALAVLFLLVAGLTSLLVNTAIAQDNMAYKDLPQQSRADRLGTFTYVFGSLGAVSHDTTAEGKRAYSLTFSENAADLNQDATGDNEDTFASVGFGLRLKNDVDVELAVSTLNGAYNKPSASGGSNPKPDQPIYEVSAMKSFDWGGPPLLRYTARIGYATLDDPDTDDNIFFGVGVGHDPFRVELRQYDFGVFESQVLAFTYLYDF